MQVTEEMLAKAPEYVQKWTRIGLCTDAYTADERAEIPARVRALYKVSKLTAPDAVVIVPGPITGVIVAGYVQHLLDMHLGKNELTPEWHRALIAACLRADQVGGDKGVVLDHCKRLLAELGLAVPAGDPKPLSREAKAVAELVGAAKKAVAARDHGNELPWSTCQIEFGRHVVGVDIDYTAWDAWLALAHIGVRYLLPRFAVVCERAEVIRTDPQHRLHCATGPAKRWRDGHEVYSWHGNVVPDAWIKRPQDLDARAILREPNAELRRCACEIIGWERIAAVVPHRVLDADPDPEIGTLIEVDLPGSPAQKMLRVRCGTGRTFLLLAPRASTSARHAQALKHGVEDYRPTIRT